ncbi:MAG: tetratricopeptide repeat protein [Chloroflexi bacterium]|nr:tetratricopeptide repeat protein [Chloroflexota bacterium]
MPKGVVEGPAQRIETGPTQLRDHIRELEIEVAALRRGQGDFLRILRLRDTVEDELRALTAAGIDVRPERTRVESVDNMLSNKASTAARYLVALSPAAEARRQENPPAERWWWYLDSIWAERLRKRLIRFSILFIVLVVLVVGVDYAMNRFSRLTPTERLANQHIASGEQLLYLGDYERAIPEFEEAVALLPDRFDIYISLGVLYKETGRQAEGQAALERAQQLAPDRATFLIAYARILSAVNHLDEALVTIEEAISLKPDSAEAYLIRAGVYEAQNEIDKAIADLEKASDLARAQNQNALYVLARTRMGMLLQRGPDLGFPGAGQ